ncbi:hypothetical protein An04g04910 [Aspergillus niger]|uniref:Uncharacterized protein n=2 Tax=Aspergillus niger TaxID=5061 RepID=A2QIV9_ASPNC|nr:hypothetical protein An04g04910 [Aspergillus niger]CAK38753.1 hypothetical protein An04g04910 [Aspergillus niger]
MSLVSLKKPQTPDQCIVHRYVSLPDLNDWTIQDAMYECLYTDMSPRRSTIGIPRTQWISGSRLNNQNGGVGAEWIMSRLEGETRKKKRGALRVSLRLRYYGFLRFYID